MDYSILGSILGHPHFGKLPNVCADNCGTADMPPHALGDELLG